MPTSKLTHIKILRPIYKSITSQNVIIAIKEAMIDIGHRSQSVKQLSLCFRILSMPIPRIGMCDYGTGSELFIARYFSGTRQGRLRRIIVVAHILYFNVNSNI